jgi:DNA-binding MarR family transcriptional regulator
MTPDPFVDAMKQWTQLSMRNSTRNFIHYARESGLSISHFGAIFYIYRTGSCGVTEIADQLGVTSAAASQMLERLVKQGVVLRTEDPGDRRVKRIMLTDKGRRILDEAIQARQSWFEELAHSLSPSEKDSVVTALKLLIGKVNQMTAGAVPTH